VPKIARDSLLISFLVGIIWLGWQKSDDITFFIWRSFNQNKINVGVLTISLPKNWITVKENNHITFLREPVGSGSLSIGYNKITRQGAENNSFTSKDGRNVKYQEFEAVNVGNYEGFIANVKTDSSRIDALVSFPEHSLRGYFIGEPNAYSEFLNMIKNAKPRKW